MGGGGTGGEGGLDASADGVEGEIAATVAAFFVDDGELEEGGRGGKGDGAEAETADEGMDAFEFGIVELGPSEFGVTLEVAFGEAWGFVEADADEFDIGAGVGFVDFGELGEMIAVAGVGGEPEVEDDDFAFEGGGVEGFAVDEGAGEGIRAAHAGDGFPGADGVAGEFARDEGFEFFAEGFGVFDAIIAEADEEGADHFVFRGPVGEGFGLFEEFFEFILIFDVGVPGGHEFAEFSVEGHGAVGAVGMGFEGFTGVVIAVEGEPGEGGDVFADPEGVFVGLGIGGEHFFGEGEAFFEIGRGFFLYFRAAGGIEQGGDVVGCEEALLEIFNIDFDDDGVAGFGGLGEGEAGGEGDGGEGK